jgi:hypothetical protein
MLADREPRPAAPAFVRRIHESIPPATSGCPACPSCSHRNPHAANATRCHGTTALSYRTTRRRALSRAVHRRPRDARAARGASGAHATPDS